jgi:hypothetical protein
MELEKTVLKIISEVNRTLGQYEKDWVSCERIPGVRERCKSFEHFIELRFNRECYKIPELQKLVEATDGHLFSCTSLDNPDTEKRRFTLAHVEMLDPKLIRDEDTDIKEMLDEVLKIFGGRKISFNGVKKKIKFVIED